MTLFIVVLFPSETSKSHAAMFKNPNSVFLRNHRSPYDLQTKSMMCQVGTDECQVGIEPAKYRF